MEDQPIDDILETERKNRKFEEKRVWVKKYPYIVFWGKEKGKLGKETLNFTTDEVLTEGEWLSKLQIHLMASYDEILI